VSTPVSNPGESREAVPGAPLAAETDHLLAAQRSDDFVELKKRFRGFVFPMTAVFLGWYLLYVVASGWARDFMGQKLLGNINVAYVFGLLQFVSTFLIAYLYERHMDKKVDPIAARIRNDVEGVDVR
jgi:uncharacterized membrane protein (DUF485 family)